MLADFDAESRWQPVASSPHPPLRWLGVRMWRLDLLAFLPCRLCLTALCRGQPLTPIGVDCLIVAPFWAVNAVGIFSLLLQRLPLAASAENLP
jgi:hypothetical protein